MRSPTPTVGHQPKSVLAFHSLTRGPAKVRIPVDPASLQSRMHPSTTTRKKISNTHRHIMGSSASWPIGWTPSPSNQGTHFSIIIKDSTSKHDQGDSRISFIYQDFTLMKFPVRSSKQRVKCTKINSLSLRSVSITTLGSSPLISSVLAHYQHSSSTFTISGPHIWFRQRGMGPCALTRRIRTRLREPSTRGSCYLSPLTGT
jgi:hypothetical protein